MSTETTIPVAETPAPPIKQAGEGAQGAPDPFKSLLLPQVSEQNYQEYPPSTGGKAADIIRYAKQFIGTPYKWGGSSPTGFDCSGLTQYVFSHFGIDLPRISYQQGNGGTPVSRDQMQPGDLVLWDTSSRNDGADHVAIYIGNGQIIAAPKPGDVVKIQPLYGNYFARRYL